MSEHLSLDDSKRRSSKRVANAANGRKQRTEKSKKIKKSLCSVDFNKLEMSSLLRYKRFFKLTTSTSASKAEHIAVVRRHFVNHPRLRDVEVISAFLYANQQHKLQNKQALQMHLAQQAELKNQQQQAAAAAAATAVQR